MIEEKVAAYAAGLFDGEGSFNMNAGHPDNIYIEIGSTHKDTLLWCRKHFNGTIREQAPGGPRKKTFYMWRIYKKADVLWFMRTVLPYSITRKADLLAYLEVYG